MALVLKDRVQETTTSPGTGDATLNGAVTGFQTFSAAIGNGNTCYYTIADQGGPNWEVGIGTYVSSGNVLQRTIVLSSSAGGTTKVDFSTGTQAIFVTYPAEKSVNLDGTGNVSALGTVNSGTWAATTIAVAYGGTGTNTSTGSGSVVLSNSPALTTPNLGTPSAITLSNGTGLPLGTGVSGTLPTGNGGTGLTSFTSGGAVYATNTSTLTTGTLPVSAGGTGSTTSTGSGSVVLSTSPTLTTPNIGAATGTSLVASNGVVTTGAYGGTFTTGVAIDYSSGLARISVDNGDDIAFYAGGVGVTPVFRINDTGAIGVGAGTISFGTAGQALVSNGPSSAPSWTSLPSATYTRTSFTATSGQTTFSAVYVPGYVEVFLNGVLLNAADYTASNGTDVVLNVGAVTGDIVELVAYNATLVTTASESTNIAGGIASQIPYQVGPGSTAFNSGLTFNGTTFTTSAISTPGNLTFTGTGNRITGDFSNGTLVNRVMFQNSVVNANTAIGILPNGTGVNSFVRAYNNSDPTSASFADIGVVGSTDVRIRSDRESGGTYLPLTMYTGGSERLRIDTSGNVGIGTSSPQARLSVSNAGAAGLEFFTNFPGGGVGTYIQSFNRSGGVYVDTAYYANSHVFWANGSERMRIDSSGNVGIGITAPTTALDVLGTIEAQVALTQDAVRLAGRAGGTSSYSVTLTPTTLTANRTLTLPDENATLGYLNIPQNSQSANYTLVAADAGKHVFHPSADTTARTFTIPANSSVPYAIGTAITFVNQNGAGVITISINTDTMRLAGAGTTGNRTLAANGVATAIKITSTEWIISGTGLT